MHAIAKWLITTAAVLASASASADRNFTIFGGINYTVVDTTYEGGATNTLGSDFSGTGLRIGGTIGVLDWLDLEAGWGRFGSEDGTISFEPICTPSPCPPGTPDEVVDASQRGSSFWIAAVPKLRRGAWELFGKAGAARTTRELRLAQTLERNTSELLLGVGASWYSPNGIGVRIEAERIGSSASQYGLSLAYRF